MTDSRLRLILAGPLSPPLGGTTVPFEGLVRSLSDRSDVAVSVVRTTGIRGGGIASPARAAALVRRLSRAIPGADVVTLHVATSGLHIAGPLVAYLSGRHGVPFVIRKFGGTDPREGGAVRWSMIRWTLRRAGLYLAETKALVAEARADGIEHARWFPNSRPMPPLPDRPAGEEGRCTRFVFLGQVRGEKGIRELIQAAERLSDEAAVDVFGPLGFDVDESAFCGLSRVRYRGVVAPEDVHATLASYDALVLPSYGEGYPGAIIEAYAAGLPVVCTRGPALAELVDESSGILVEPRDATALHEAMLTLTRDPRLAARLRAGVVARRGEFSEEIWNERFVDYCRELVQPRGGSEG
jgi:glycosyltransferase involved in cell wall biosynthesis